MVVLPSPDEPTIAVIALAGAIIRKLDIVANIIELIIFHLYILYHLKNTKMNILIE